MTQAQTARCAPCSLGAAQSRRGQEVSTHGCWGHAQAHPQDPATEQKRHTHTANTEAVACGAVGTLHAPAQIGTHWHLASPSSEVWTGQRSKHAAEPQRRKSMHTTRKGEAHKRGWRGHAQSAHPHNIHAPAQGATLSSWVPQQAVGRVPWSHSTWRGYSLS
jgi:hypothetical protein